MISGDTLLFLIMILCGALISLFFDLLRAFRITVKPNTVIVAVSDAIFIFVSIFAAAALVWNFGSGKFRFYELTGLFLGSIFYFLLLGRWVLKFLIIIDENILKFARFILKILLTPPRFLYKILIVPTHKYAKSIRRRSQLAHDKRIQKPDSKFYKKT